MRRDTQATEIIRRAVRRVLRDADRPGGEARAMELLCLAGIRLVPDTQAALFMRHPGGTGLLRAAARGLDEAADRRQRLTRASAAAEMCLAAGSSAQLAADDTGISADVILLGEGPDSPGALVLLGAGHAAPDASRCLVPLAEAVGLVLRLRAVSRDRDRERNLRLRAETEASAAGLLAASAGVARDAGEEIGALVELLRGLLTRAAESATDTPRDLLELSLDPLTRIEQTAASVTDLPLGHLPPAPVAMDTVLADAVESERAGFRDAEVRVVHTRGRDVPDLVVDAGLLRRVCSRVLEAARRRASPGDEVRVGARRQGGHVAILIVAPGRPEPGEVMERLWEPLGPSPEGVPYAAVRRILDHYRGRIVVATTRRGELAFEILLPIAATRERRRGGDRRGRAA